MSSHDQEDLNFIVCDLCNYACIDKEDLEKHLKTHEETVKVETEEGHEGQGVEDKMEESSEVDQDDSVDSNLYNCDKCEFSTKTKTSLDSHKDSVHEGVKRYKCDQCDYATAWPSNLNKHKKGVHDKIRLQCEECDFMTTNHGVLKKHMNNVHKKERTKKRKGAVRQLLKCDHCNFTTSLERRLMQHMDEIHPEQIEELVFEPVHLPFKCDECEYAAAVGSYLINHKKMLHEVVKDNCDKCEFEAHNRAEMITHKMMVHGEVRFEPYKTGPNIEIKDITKGYGAQKNEKLDENAFKEEGTEYNEPTMPVEMSVDEEDAPQ